MMKKRIAIAWFLLLSTGLINAQENILSKAHFQYQAEISIDSPKSLQMLRLPEAIQSKLYSRNAQDIRVFNSDDLMLPSLIRYQGKDEGKTAVPPVSKTLSFYPIPGVLPKNHKEDPPNTSANEKSPDVKSLEVKLELKCIRTITLTLKYSKKRIKIHRLILLKFLTTQTNDLTESNN